MIRNSRLICGRRTRRAAAIAAVFAAGCALAAIGARPALAQRAAPEELAEIEFKQDIVYGKGGGEDLHLDLARPKRLAEPAPCILVIHGGAWRGGDKAGHAEQVRQFARRGYVAASVQYRFCPQHRFPAQAEDVKCAVRYLRANAAELNIDPQRIGAVGFSAGAHLAMLLGVLDKEDGLEGDGGHAEQSSKVQAVVAFFGPTDLLADDIPEQSEKFVDDLVGSLRADNPEDRKRASPITYVTAGDAPTLIYQGTRDHLVPHTQAFKMTDALTNAGVGGRVELLIGQGHGWRGSDLQRTVEGMQRFFDEQLKK